MDDNMKCSDDEDDLAALRMAALQTLKKKQTAPQFGGYSPKRGRGRGVGKFRGGGQWRNGAQNWARNSNLIAVPVVGVNTNEQKIVDLPLPQNRYCKKEDGDGEVHGGTSKFDRYDNSEDSEESEEEDTGGLERSNSLEALMEELENEIQGTNREVKPKKRKKSCEGGGGEKIKENLKPEAPVLEVQVVKEAQPVQSPPKEHKRPFVRARKWHPKPPPLLPPPNQNFITEAPPPLMSFAAMPPQVFPPPQVYSTPHCPPYVPPSQIYEQPPIRPLSPLLIEPFGSQPPILAPLSPRSAAFVLENRAIVEKRKRRSYSRSPSPRFSRRSKSPPRLRSLSPPPTKRPISPRHRPSQRSPPVKKSVRDRLGTKPKKPTAANAEEPPAVTTTSTETSGLDPVLEARRRKFENNEITVKEGVIRLKTSTMSTTTTPPSEKVDKEEADKKAVDNDTESIDEDALLDDGDDEIELDIKSDHLFSDEDESDSDNEGRFKIKNNNGKQQEKKVTVLPFRKLVEDKRTVMPPKRAVPPALSFGSGGRRRSRSPLKPRQKAAAPIIVDRKIEIKIRNPSKYESGDDKDGTKGKKGEEGKKDVKKKGVEEKRAETPPPPAVVTSRRVELGKTRALIAPASPPSPETDDGTDDLLENGVLEALEDVSESISGEGDLRAQLSRKRAERQKHPVPDAVPSRLLQTALQSVGFKNRKRSKSKAKKDENKEMKLPIHLRLGAAAKGEGFMSKKTKKHKRGGGSVGGGGGAGGVQVQDKV